MTLLWLKWKEYLIPSEAKINIFLWPDQINTIPILLVLILKFIFFSLEVYFPLKNLAPHLYCMHLKGKISEEKCEVPPPTYDTFADSDLSPCSVDGSIGLEAHSCDEFVSQPWCAIQKWFYYTTKQFVKTPWWRGILPGCCGFAV